MDEFINHQYNIEKDECPMLTCYGNLNHKNIITHTQKYV